MENPATNQIHSISDHNNELFRKIVELAPVPTAILDAQGRVEFINRKVNDIIGYQISDIPDIQTWWLKAYPDENYRQEVISRWNFHLKQAIEEGREITGEEYAVTCKNGQEKIIYISGCAVLDKFFILFIDMTAYRQMENALHESEQHYKMISELTTDYVFKLLVHADGKITMDFVSDNFSTVTGRDKEQSGVDFWDTFIHPDDLPGLMKELSKIITYPQSNEFECRSFIHGNKLRWVHIFSKSEWDPKENRITSIVGAVKDISERKWAEAEIIEKNIAIEARNREYLRLNEELLFTNRMLKEAKEKAEESNRLKTSFLQNMSHEIRTPMNAIMGFASLLNDNYNNKAKLEKFSSIICQRCNDLLEIINDILDISKIESGQVSANYEPCDLRDLFAELNQFFHEHQKRIDKENIVFSMHLSQDLCGNIVFTDKIKLKQILINLIGNAFKFTSVGSIECSCQRNNSGDLEFTVSDTGIGIPADKHDLIFERFVQLDEEESMGCGGTGLGLSIVKGLINILGGRIWLESKTADDNSGTTFYFILPQKMVMNPLSEENEVTLPM